ncbi:branched-chain amino acid ABC transporter permease (plasmid) [Tistrella mobilis]|uniref:ABC transporter permease n=1 Tax=Tistrella mobilis TaxID=171437 RepID=A0A162KVY7_9PROT|nr:branched-chain amino acid ABC transporter permease [Tistrella mobilis]KYO52278.1 ABC transporter permease [Tistrella mobilis]
MSDSLTHSAAAATAPRPGPGRRLVVHGLGLAVFAAMPLIAAAVGDPFVVSLFTRFLIYAIAAVALDLVMGYGALISFGHAAFFGLGGYVVGIIAHHAAETGTIFGLATSNSALVVWPVAIGLSALLALIIGGLSLRTQGVQFIMITLAFSQMVYFMLVSLEVYGGDDGLLIMERNTLPGIDLADPTVFYYLCLAVLAGWLLLCRRLVGSRFGMVLRGLKQNERRAVNLGFAPLPHRLAAFVISGAGTGLAGVLWANYALYVSPDMAAWSKSGEFMSIVILGGVGTLFGPVIGAAVFLGLEQLLAIWTEHWMLVMGPVLVAVVLFARRGLYGFLVGERSHD